MSQISIEISGLRIFASIGVWDRERHAPQPVTVDILAWLNEPPQADKLHETASYDDIARIAQEIADRGHHDLIETLSLSIAKELKAMTPVESVQVKVTKTPQTINADATSATARL